MFDFRRNEILRANIFNLLRVVVAKRRELQMADLVSGNLKEEKGAHSIQLVHSGGLLPRHATCCFQNRSDAADPGPECTFGWKRAKTATPWDPRTTERWRN